MPGSGSGIGGYEDAGVRGSRGRQPGGAGKPPKPKPKKRKPNPLSSWLAEQPGAVRPDGTVIQPSDPWFEPKPPSVLDRKGQKDYRRKLKILQRQRQLRAAGYSIVADGVWGPKSQSAWNDYRGRGGRDNTSVSHPPSVLDSHGNVRLSEKERAARQADAQAEAARIARIKDRRDKQAAARQRKAERQAILDHAAKLKRDPHFATKLSLRELTDVLLDKETNFKLGKDPAAASAVQWHLREAGYDVKVTGKLSPRDFKFLEKEYKREAAKEREQQIKVVRAAIYGTNVPGTTPDWFKSFGPLPKPEELVKQLQAGDFRADAMWRTINAHWQQNPEAAWQAVKRTQLVEMSETLQPFGVSAIFGKLFGPESVPEWQSIVDIFSIQDAMPFGNYRRAGYSPEETLAHLKHRAENKDTIAENSKRLGELHTRALALLKSDSPGDFDNLYVKLMAVEEQRFKRFQQKLAAGDTSWWMKPIVTLGDVAEWPVENLMNITFYSGMEINQTLELYKLGIGDKADRDIRWEDALVFLGTDPGDLPVAYDRMVEKELSPYVRIPLSFGMDPLLFLRPFRLGSTLLKYVALGPTRMGGYVLTGKGLRAASVYERGTWSKMGLLAETADKVPLVRDTRLSNRLLDLGKKQAQLRDAALGAASKRLKTATRLGWKKPKRYVKGESFEMPKMPSSRVAKLVDRTDAEMADLVERLPQLRPFLVTAKRNFVSLKLSASGIGADSQYGGTLRGYMAETFRPLALDRVATEVAESRFQVAISEGMSHAEATDVANRYKDMIFNAVGSFLSGGADESLRAFEFHVMDEGVVKEVVERNLIEEIEKRVAMANEDIVDIWMPKIQDWLADGADAEFEGMKAKARAAGPKVGGEAPVQAAPDETVGGFDVLNDGRQVIPTEDELENVAAEMRYFPVFVDVGDPEVVVVGRFGERHVELYDRLHAAGEAPDWLQGVRGDDQFFQVTGGVIDEDIFMNPSIDHYKPGVVTEEAVAVKFVKHEDIPASAAAPELPASPLREGVDHPMWDENGKWRGVGKQDDLVATIRKSFEEPRSMRNARFGRGFDAGTMREMLDRDIRVETTRFASWFARGIEAGTIDNGFDYEAKLAEKILPLKAAWKLGEDGMYYDQRQLLKTSNLYGRHLDWMKERRLVFNEEGKTDFLAVLGEAAPEGEWGDIENSLFDFAAIVMGATAKESPIPGISRAGIEGHQNALIAVKDAVDRRRFALREAENGALSNELAKQGAVWRALQYAQARHAQYLYHGLSSQLVLWKFATLALRPAWAIRNILDNAAKCLIAGARDPRYYMIGPGSAIHSVFDLGLNHVRDAVLYFDTMYGTNVVHFWDEIVRMTWKLPSEQLAKLFEMHNVPVPASVFEAGLRREVWDTGLGLNLTRAPETIHAWEENLLTGEMNRVEVDARDTLLGRSKLDKAEQRAGELLDPALQPFRWFTENAWALMGDIPENYFRRVIYRSTYNKAMKGMLRAGGGSILEPASSFPKVAADRVTVELDEAGIRAAMKKQLPARFHSDIDALKFVIDYDSEDFVGMFVTGHNTLHISLPASSREFINTIERAEQWERGFNTLLSHETQHVRQYARWSSSTGVTNRFHGAIDRLNDALPYKIRPEEIGANAAQRLHGGKWPEGLVKVKVSGPPLPTQHTMRANITAVEMELEATRRAIKSVEDTLFDYNAISVAEDNVKILFPFVQFWRKNTQFWVKSLGTKPWLDVALLHYDDERDELHNDLPKWMQRYFHTEEIKDALSVVPGLDAAFEFLGLGDGAQLDPISMTSFSPFYRAFKSENQFLPTDRKGIAIIGPIIDALNDWGLGLSPFFRKPLENFGIASQRSWQRIWPQTSLMEAIGVATGEKNLIRMAHSLEMVSSLGFGGVDSDALADNFDYYVQTVVAEQVARGETPDVEKARQVVRDWFLTQNLWGYFGGIYWRRATPEDMYMAKLTDDLMTGERGAFSSREWKLIKMWSMRGWDWDVYQDYLRLLPVIESYYRGDLQDKLDLKKKHPGITRWVDGDYTGRPISRKFIRHTQRYVDQQLFFDSMEIADTLDLPWEMKKAAEDMLVSPELRAHWKRNGTSSRIRERMVAAEAHDYYRDLSKGYFSIPDDDFETRDAFLNHHPDLIRYWNRNNDPTDDLEAVMGNVKATLREIYFGMVKTDGWDAAADYLKQFNFMFEGTKAESKIKNGEWIGGTGSGKWSAERLHAFLAAKPSLNWFFDDFMKKVGEKKAWAWLEESDSERAQTVKDYLKQYGKHSQKSIDYMKAKGWLKLYFDMPLKERTKWLHGGSEGAKIVQDFFDKYAKRGHTQHAKDYLAIKPDLKWFFDVFMKRVGKTEAWKWLDAQAKAGDPRAVKLKDYFKKYGKEHQMERAFKKLMKDFPGLAHGTPEQVRRLMFWKMYFDLPPDERPGFVASQAENYGVFVYGEFGEEYRHDLEQEYTRRAVGVGLSDRQAAYLYVKPLLDFYSKLDKEEKQLFLRANPELQEYFDKYSHKSLTGDKKLDAVVEEYFKLPPDSLARSDFLKKHPEVQSFFDKRNPSGAAMRSLLDQFFGLPNAILRKDFLARHPEIQAYFDMRKAERDAETAQLRAFDMADPRLKPFYDNADDMIRGAEAMRARLRQSAFNHLSPDGIETRRDRRDRRDLPVSV